MVTNSWLSIYLQGLALNVSSDLVRCQLVRADNSVVLVLTPHHQPLSLMLCKKAITRAKKIEPLVDKREISELFSRVTIPKIETYADRGLASSIQITFCSDDFEPITVNTKKFIQALRPTFAALVAY